MKEFCFKELGELQDKFADFQQKNHFGLISDLRELFKPKQLKNGLGWTRISTIGNLELCDYNAGLVCVEIRLNGQGRYDENKKLVADYFVHFHVGTLDDGSWDAWSKPYESKEKCLEQVFKTAKILDDLVKMPNTKDLNEMLQPYGLFGGREP